MRSINSTHFTESTTIRRFAERQLFKEAPKKETKIKKKKAPVGTSIMREKVKSQLKGSIKVCLYNIQIMYTPYAHAPLIFLSTHKLNGTYIFHQDFYKSIYCS